MFKSGTGFSARPVQDTDWPGAVVCSHIRGTPTSSDRHLARLTFDYGTDYMLLIACEQCSAALMFTDAHRHGRVLSEVPPLLDEIWPQVQALRDIIRKAAKGRVSSKEVGKVRRLQTLLEEAVKVASTINIEEEDEDEKATEEPPSGLGIRVVDKPYTHLSNSEYDELMKKIGKR